MEAEAKRFLRLKAERGDRRRAQLNPGGRFVLIGSDEAIEKAHQQQGAFDYGDEAAAAPQDLPEITQGCSGGLARLSCGARRGATRRCILDRQRIRQGQNPRSSKHSRRAMPSPGSSQYLRPEADVVSRSVPRQTPAMSLSFAPRQRGKSDGPGVQNEKLIQGKSLPVSYIGRNSSMLTSHLASHFRSVHAAEGRTHCPPAASGNAVSLLL